MTNPTIHKAVTVPSQRAHDANGSVAQRSVVVRPGETLTEAQAVARWEEGGPLPAHTGFTVALAELGAGIVDLTSSLVGDPPIFILGMEVILPGGVTLGRVESVLGSGVLRDLEVSVQPAAVRI